MARVSPTFTPLSRRRLVRPAVAWLLVVAGAAAASCGPTPGAAPAVTTGAPAADAAGGAGPGVARTTGAPAAPGDPGAPPPQSLVLWTVDDLAAASDDGETLPLGETIAAFTGSDPARRVTVAVKPAYGPTGIVAFLTSTADVVPSALPDAAIVPLESVTELLAAGLIEPLPEDFPAERVTGTFPFAAARALDAGGQAVAVPIAVDVLHAIARGGPPPATWTDVGAAGVLLVPAGVSTLPALADDLAFYAAAGGSLERLPVVTAGEVQRVLTFLGDRLADGGLNGVDVALSPRAVWNAFLEDRAAAAIVRGSEFVAHQAGFPAITWGPLPGPDGPAPPVAWGRAMIVLTADPERRARALDLARWLTDPERRGWVLAAGYLPPTAEDWDATLAQTLAPPPSSAYAQFLADTLSGARSVGAPDRWLDGWAAAVGEVMGGGSPEAAVTRFAAQAP